MKKLFSLLLLCLAVCPWAMAKDYTVASPDGHISMTLNGDNGLRLTIVCQGKTIVSNAEIGLEGYALKAGKAKSSVVKLDTDAPLYRQSHLTMEGRQLDVALGGGFGLQLRAYDEGVAWRFYTTRKGETIIKNELMRLPFSADTKCWLPYSTDENRPFAMAFQATYDATTLGNAKATPAFLPATVEVSGIKATLLESDLRSYPGMFVKADKGGLQAVFAPYPKTMDYYKWRGMSHVASTEDYIAKTTGARSYPWRVIALTKCDTEMPVNNLVYALATPCELSDVSWIKPGKVAWDWWHDWNLRGVDFKAGINTPTYLYYIDFAARNHIPYIVLDEGWYDSSKGDLMHPIADIDLPRLVKYGREKGVDIVLWTVFNVLDEHLEDACKQYGDMGIKGFKVDFLDRNDQTAVEMAERIARTCAAHKLVLDYHGYFAPTGMSRMLPNIINYEGVFGMEECRWAKAETDMPLYDVTFPFIRMMAGQVDFTPGAMRNGTKKNWVMCYENPCSMGTRCHQLACYVVHDTPFTMLADAPTTYNREQECVDMITSIPDVFTKTIVPMGKLGEYIITAREKDGAWYVGGMTSWTARDLTLKLDFLTAGKQYEMTLFRDGINANHNAEDYAVERRTVNSATQLPLHMASGGGFLLKLKIKN